MLKYLEVIILILIQLLISHSALQRLVTNNPFVLSYNINNNDISTISVNVFYMCYIYVLIYYSTLLHSILKLNIIMF